MRERQADCQKGDDECQADDAGRGFTHFVCSSIKKSDVVSIMIAHMDTKKEEVFIQA